MTMKKTFDSKNEVVILSDADGGKDLFPVNYKYIMGATIYRVIKAYKADNTEMRTLVTSEGITQEVTIATIKKDKEEPGFRELPPDDLPVPE